jgi:hypothetical protein
MPMEDTMNHQDEETETTIPPEVMADLEYAVQLVLTGKKDPEFSARVRAESEKIREEIFREHGLLDIGVPAIRALRDGEEE